MIYKPIKIDRLVVDNGDSKARAYTLVQHAGSPVDFLL